MHRLALSHRYRLYASLVREVGSLTNLVEGKLRHVSVVLVSELDH